MKREKGGLLWPFQTTQMKQDARVIDKASRMASKRDTIEATKKA